MMLLAFSAKGEGKESKSYFELHSRNAKVGVGDITTTTHTQQRRKLLSVIRFDFSSPTLPFNFSICSSNYCNC